MSFGVRFGDTIKVENSLGSIWYGNKEIARNAICERTGPFVVKHTSEKYGDLYYLAVTRNHTPSWLNLHFLVLCDANGEPVGAFQRKMLEFNTWKERLHYIYGMTLTGVRHEAKAILSGGEIKNKYIGIIESE